MDRVTMDNFDRHVSDIIIYEALLSDQCIVASFD